MSQFGTRATFNKKVVHCQSEAARKDFNGAIKHFFCKDKLQLTVRLTACGAWIDTFAAIGLKRGANNRDGTHYDKNYATHGGA